MKKIVSVLLVLAVLIALAPCTIADSENLPEEWHPYWVVNHQYAKVAVVAALDFSTDTVYFLINFGDGYFWYTYTGVEDLEVGDICGLLMHDNGTTEILDDSILSVTYSGWTI